MINKIIDKMEFLFKILLLLYTMIGYNGLLNGNIIISYIMWPMFVLGAVIILWKTINIKCYIKTSGFFGMILFIISFITSMLINYRYELKQNIISLILIIFYFGILYLHDYMKDKKIRKRDGFF